jgi:hypothetical protein
MTERKVFVLHALRSDSRSTTINHAACFGRYISDCKVEYVNVFGEIPAEIASELVIVTYELVALRNLPIWHVLVDRMKPMLKTSKLRVLMPQDDYSKSNELDDFVCAHNFDFVFTPLTRDLEQIYPKSIGRGVQFREAFTGYFEESTRENLQRFSKPLIDRAIDLGQRVRFLPPQLGTEAGRKGFLAIEFAQSASVNGFVCDVSTKPEDVFVGDAWWEFLGNTKFTVSRRGGASMADPKGLLADRVRRFQMRHPGATMEDISRRVSLRGGREGDFSAISPRLFEAAALGVCQILEPDHYVDGLEPWVHYIPLSEDFSNIDEVFQLMRDLDRCSEMVKASQELLLDSKAFTYSAFIENFRREIDLEYDTMGVFVSSDSSVSFDGVLGKSVEGLIWVQDYVARAYLRKSLKTAINSINNGKLLILDDVDVKWSDHAVMHRESLIVWLEAFLTRRFPLESFVIPWRTMTSLISS